MMTNSIRWKLFGLAMMSSVGAQRRFECLNVKSFVGHNDAAIVAQ